MSTVKLFESDYRISLIIDSSLFVETRPFRKMNKSFKKEVERLLVYIEKYKHVESKRNQLLFEKIRSSMIRNLKKSVEFQRCYLDTPPQFIWKIYAIRNQVVREEDLKHIDFVLDILETPQVHMAFFLK